MRDCRGSRSHICGCLFLLPPPSSPRAEKKKKETAAEKQELPPRHGAVLGSCGSGWAEAADLRVADQCPPAQEPHLPGQPLWHSPFLFVFPLRLLHRELLLCNCKMGMRFPISVFLMLRKTLRWIAVNGECSYSYVVTICAVDTIFCFD